MQNELIAAISSVATEDIKQEIGNSWYTIKIDGTKDITGVKNMSITQANKKFLAYKVKRFNGKLGALSSKMTLFSADWL